MNEENREANAAEELERARTSHREARILAEAHLPHGAASRAYFAVFHAARALLYSAGIEARTHRGVLTAVSEHFVKPGILSPRHARLLSRMQRDREDADYLAGAVFTDEDAGEALATAEAFLAEVERLLDT